MILNHTHTAPSFYGMHLSVYNCIYRVTPRVFIFGTQQQQQQKHLAKPTFGLFFFFFSFSGIELSHFRIPGVLQRFAGTYLIVATVHLLFARPFDDSRVGRLHGTVGLLLVLLR